MVYWQASIKGFFKKVVFIVRKNPILFDGSEMKAIEMGRSGFEGFIKVLEAFR